MLHCFVVHAYTYFKQKLDLNRLILGAATGNMLDHQVKSLDLTASII